MRKTQRDSLSEASNLERSLQLQGEFRRRLLPLLLPPLQAGVFLFVQRCPDAHAIAVGEALGLRASTQTPTKYTLIRKGLVARTRPSDDHRLVALRLTPRGEKIVEKITERLRDMPNVGACL